jgi:epoxyqueuosine reductase
LTGPAPFPEEVAAAIRVRALELGFDAAGITPVSPSAWIDAYRAWVDQGMAGEMGYLSREDAIEKRGNPQLLVPGSRTAIVVARGYSPDGVPASEGVPPERAVFSRYARNEDYHELLRDRLIELQNWISAELAPVNGRAYVDTGAVLERELAVRAGLGWVGRNTMHIRPGRGSYHFLGVILVDLEIPADAPFVEDRCGSCHRCLSACPTGALLGRNETGAPLLDARRCISYLTIELKGPIPRDLRPRIGNRIYGCDICQEVCPHNSPKFVHITREPAFLPRTGVHGAELIELVEMSSEEFSRRFKGSAVKRTKRRGLLRNVAVALGNWGAPEAVPALVKALADEEPLVRGHAAWALGRIAAAEGQAMLRDRLGIEEDAWVRAEIDQALNDLDEQMPGDPVRDKIDSALNEAG